METKELTLGSAFNRIVFSEEYSLDHKFGSLNLLFEIEEYFNGVAFLQIENTRLGLSFISGHPGGMCMRIRAISKTELKVAYQVPMTKGTLTNKSHDSIFKLNDAEQMQELMELIDVRKFYKPKVAN